MLRIAGGVLVGAVTWIFAVAALGFVLREAWPQMAEIREMTLLTVPMLFARLAVSALSSVAGGFAASLTSGEKVKASLGSGVLLLLVFVPYHTTIWHSFPVWYHLTFFVSLPVLGAAGGALSGRR
jgi:hypothetical protein